MRLIDIAEYDLKIASLQWIEYGKNSTHLKCIRTADLPTVDAEPVAHGFWKKTAAVRKYECSKCGEIIILFDNNIDDYKYCFGCGAKMDRKEDQMPDPAAVTRAMEICFEQNGGGKCDECPYSPANIKCKFEMVQDAIMLLREGKHGTDSDS